MTARIDALTTIYLSIVDLGRYGIGNANDFAQTLDDAADQIADYPADEARTIRIDLLAGTCADVTDVVRARLSQRVWLEAAE